MACCIDLARRREDRAAAAREAAASQGRETRGLRAAQQDPH
jgi:hypothetical protein